MIVIEIMSNNTASRFKIKITEQQLEKIAVKLINEIYTIKNEKESKEGKR
jgi:hypothetical protein